MVVTTPKVTLELEAPASGVLTTITTPPDEIAKVGETLGVISTS